MSWRIALLAIASCSAPPKSPPALAKREAAPAPPSAELSPALAPLHWWLGDWALRTGGTEHWVAAGGAIYGVALMPGGAFEVMIVDDAPGPGPADGTLRFYAMPGGQKSVEFAEQARQRRGIVFANPEHDHPKTIGYFLDDDQVLHAEVTGNEPTLKLSYTVAPPRRAPALEAADRAFSADTGKRGIDGWMAAFEPAGWMMRRGAKVEGTAIAELMAPTLTAGTLSWAPLASGVDGDLGFTVGTATYQAKQPADSWRSSYVTIWARQPDGAWKVRFDTGRVVNE